MKLKKMIAPLAGITVGCAAISFLFTNCSRSGFHTGAFDQSLELSSTVPDLSDSVDPAKYILKCVPKNQAQQKLSALELAKPSTKISIQPNESQGYANDLFQNKAASTFYSKTQSTSDNLVSRSLVVTVNHKCLNESSNLSVISQSILQKPQGLVADIDEAAYVYNSPNDMTESELVQILESDKCIRFVDKNEKYTISQAVTTELNDTRYPELQHLINIKHKNIYPSYFNAANGINQTIRLAIIDSGIDPTHPDLANNILRNPAGQVIGLNAIDNTTDVADSGFHGTHVAGIAAGVSGNAAGISGVMGQSIKIISVKVSSDGSSVDLDAVINGIRWATDQGANVINMSIGSKSASADRPSFRQAIEYALKKQVTIVVAAGNDATQLTSSTYAIPAKYSAIYKGVITVGSIDASTDARSSFSNYAPEYVNIMAPGSNGTTGILSTVPQRLSASGYASKVTTNAGTSPIHGTSMASPVVAGAVSLAVGVAKSRGYDANPEQISQLLSEGSDRIAGLTSSSYLGNKLNIEKLFQRINTDTNITSDYVDRKLASGNVAIESNPTSVVGLVGQARSLSVKLKSTSSILVNYQWYRNGRALIDERSATLSLPALTTAQAGEYKVVMKAGNNQVGSQIATVSVGETVCP